MNAKLALVDSDREWALAAEKALSGAGYAVELHLSLGKFLDALTDRRPDVLLMDMHLPGMEGREIFRALRSNPETAKMILVGLSRRPKSKDEVTAAFKAGADEYFFQPLEEALLLVRLRSLLRRAPTPAAEAALRHFGIAVFPDSRQCRVDGKDVRLTRLEFDLLIEFLRNPQRVLTRGGLIDALWSGPSGRGSRAVDRHIHALRTKLGGCGELLETLVGVGYRLTSERPRSRARSTAVRS
ncbi:MAG: response regulator transcription factor [Elusimicrobia bacterium]|nr:response regulator transcription factor [Elusimicrobiota bacterium]MDE2512399.1 response regulator transcription factor [Elusimicrobiota bacterium]